MDRGSISAPCYEKQLLVCCSTTCLDSSRIAELRRLIALPLDWDVLLAKAEESGVTPLLNRHIAHLAPTAIPTVQPDRLKALARAAAMRSLALTAELIRILDAFAAAGIEAIPYKGPVLAIQAYGDVSLREFSDLDFVLRQHDVSAADEVLAALGFSPRFPPFFSPRAGDALVPGEYDYYDPARRLIVELHTERTLRHFPAAPNLDDLALRLVPVSIGNRAIRTFSPEDTLVFLCVHGSKDFWARILWVADVAEFVRSHRELNWDRVYNFADSVRATRMLHLGLALAIKLLGLDLPEAIRSRVRADAAADSIASDIQRRLLARDAPPMGARAAFRYRRRMAPGALSGWRYALRLSTAPAAEDWHAVRLPRALAPLYAALRPLRLVRKYSANLPPPEISH